MKIYYAPDFDSECQSHLLRREDAKSGELLLGPRGLLSFLEQRLGFSGRYDREHLREEEYRLVLLQNSQGSFFQKSLEKCDDAVATHLLGIRDELKASGFSFNRKNAPKRIKDICKIEQDVELSLGFADRWDRIIRSIKKIPVLESIELCLPEEYLTPKEKRMMLALKNAKVRIIPPKLPKVNSKKGTDLNIVQNIILGNDAAKKKAKIKGDGSFCILHAHNALEMSRILAKLYKHNKWQGKIITENNTAILAEVWKQEGLPSLGNSEASAMRPTIQLLRVVDSFLWEPLDPEAVISFLGLPVKPFPSSLARLLLNVVCEVPGVGGEKWNKVITKWSKTKGSEDVKKGKRRLDEWFYTKRYDPEAGVPVSRLTKIYQVTKEYLDKVSELEQNEERKDEIKAVSSVCKQLLQIIEIRYGKSDKIRKIELDRILSKVLPLTSTGTLEEEAGRITHYKSPSAVINEVDNLCWFGFQEKSVGKSGMWSKTELKWLEDNDIEIDGPSEKFEREKWSVTNAILNAKESLTLAVYDIEDGEITASHPMLCNLQAKIENLHAAFDLLDLEKIKQMKKRISLPVKVDQWNIKNKDSLKDRDTESFSSLENLFYYPFIWVMNYKAQIRPAGVESIPNIFTISGNIIHRMFQNFLGKNNDPAATDKNQIIKWHKENFDKYIREEGATLLRRGHESDLAKLKVVSLSAMIDVVTHLSDNGWKVKGTEVNLSGKFCGIKLTGNADIVLKRNKELAILDVKYAGDKKRRKQVEDDEDLQLAIYSRMAGDMKGYAHAGFYIILGQVLHSKNKKAFKNATTPQERDHSQAYSEIWERMENTYQNRMDEFKEGIIKVQMWDISAKDAKELPYDGINALKLRQKANEYNDYITLAGLEDEE